MGSCLPGAGDCAVQVWNPNTDERTAAYRGHASSVSVVAKSPDGAAVASAGTDGTILVWQVR